MQNNSLLNSKSGYNGCTRGLKGEQIWNLNMTDDQKALQLQNLHRSMVELSLAYDATLEGFARAMDLREREADGHILRVAEMTVHLAISIGVKDAEILNIRRGAYLHDIGNMAIPDLILHKPGSLNDEELSLVRMHPQYAYNLLISIPFLFPALDIPHCHHEKWDGSGYPGGLKGEAIPLAARIFAIVDVYDTLTSNRPYRPAWPKGEALEYIREQSGKHFDPKIVDAFLRFIPTLKS
jgi:HD-GYP domain-containing protein (c-di-GMP phosphodiesterase class II)